MPWIESTGSSWVERPRQAQLQAMQLQEPQLQADCIAASEQAHCGPQSTHVQGADASVPQWDRWGSAASFMIAPRLAYGWCRRVGASLVE